MPNFFKVIDTSIKNLGPAPYDDERTRTTLSKATQSSIQKLLTMPNSEKLHSLLNKAKKECGQ